MPLDDGRSVGFWGVLGAGAVAAVVVGVLFWPSDEPSDVDAAPSSTEVASASSTEGGGPTSSSAATTTPTTGPPVSDSDAPDATNEEGEIIIVPNSMVLIHAEAVVRGLGQDARFATEGLVEETNRATRLRPLPFDPDLEFVDINVQDASCALVNPLALDMSAISEGIYPHLDPDGFTAGIRADQFTRVSIGATGDTVVGSFSFGGESRDNSQQWETYGGSLLVELVGTYDDMAGMNGLIADGLEITATWTGTATENFTGEEADGSIMFTCLFLVGPDRNPAVPADD